MIVFAHPDGESAVFGDVSRLESVLVYSGFASKGVFAQHARQLRLCEYAAVNLLQIDDQSGRHLGRGQCLDSRRPRVASTCCV